MRIKRKKLLNQISNRSPRRYCKYAVTNNPAKVIGTNPKTIPESKVSTISIKAKSRKYSYTPL